MREQVDGNLGHIGIYGEINVGELDKLANVYLLKFSLFFSQMKVLLHWLMVVPASDPSACTTVRA